MRSRDRAASGDAKTMTRESCVRVGKGTRGIERLEAHFKGRPFALHRHDTYAVGITLLGVQKFRFRGQCWQCLPGECHILHPDELHDGSAGTADGFSYRIAYVDPCLIQEALRGTGLPFVANPVVDAERVCGSFPFEIWEIDEEIDEIGRIDFVTSLTTLLLKASRGRQERRQPLAIDSLLRVRDLIAATPAHGYSMTALEREAGLSRWTLARQFREAFGTSPSRFRILRRLDRLREKIVCGTPLAVAAMEVGFADQSHMTRQFKRAYGMTPAQWQAAIA